MEQLGLDADSIFSFYENLLKIVSKIFASLTRQTALKWTL